MSTVTIGGTQPDVINYTLSDSDDTQVGFSKPVNTVIIKCRTATALQVRDSRGADEYYTIASGDSLILKLQARIIDGVVQPFNLWLRSGSGTSSAEIIGLYGG